MLLYICLSLLYFHAAAQRLPIPQRVAALLAELNTTEKLMQLQRPDFNPNLFLTGAGLLEFNAVVQGAVNGKGLTGQFLQRYDLIWDLGFLLKRVMSPRNVTP